MSVTKAGYDPFALPLPRIRLGEDAPIVRGRVVAVHAGRRMAMLQDREAADHPEIDRETRIVVVPAGEVLPRDVKIGAAGYLTIRRGHPFFTEYDARRSAV